MRLLGADHGVEGLDTRDDHLPAKVRRRVLEGERKSFRAATAEAIDTKRARKGQIGLGVQSALLTISVGT